jgi:hypothetical protein
MVEPRKAVREGCEGAERVRYFGMRDVQWRHGRPKGRGKSGENGRIQEEAKGPDNARKKEAR